MIGWYVHHHGRGHRTRAEVVAPRVAALTDEPVVLLSSLPGGEGWVRLPADDDGPPPVDPTAHGTLHWAPRRVPGVADRVAALAGWVAAARPSAVVVDVSVEAALLMRLAGVPLVVAAMPGDRGDRAHQTAFAAADLVLAYWRREVYDPPWLRDHRVAYVGAVSRFDQRARTARSGGVVVLGGDGGGVVEGPPGATVLTADDPWSALCGADVVVAHAGQNVVAELAAARARAVLVPQDRPYAEQHRAAAALAAAGIVVAARPPVDWAATLAEAAALDPSAWSAWSGGGGADLAAAAIARVAAS